MITALVCVDRNWAIGKNRARPIVIPDDKRFLNAAISENTIIIGRRTFAGHMENELPPDCNKIVLSSKPTLVCKNAVVVHSPEEAIKEARKYDGDIYILGGAKTYESLLGYCDEVQVTYVQHSYEADAHFPNLDKLPEWVMASESEEQTYFDTIYFYRKYVRRKEYRP